MTSLSTLNDLPEENFVATLGGIYEHSPWVAEAALPARPFSSRGELLTALRTAVDSADEARKLALIRAHPDLAGKLARSGALTEESTREQAGLGLDRLSDLEYAQFTELNDQYRARFDFPFIICARLTTKEGVVSAFLHRITNNREEEISETLKQIHEIARLRLEDLVEE